MIFRTTAYGGMMLIAVFPPVEVLSTLLAVATKADEPAPPTIVLFCPTPWVCASSSVLLMACVSDPPSTPTLRAVKVFVKVKLPTPLAVKSMPMPFCAFAKVVQR